MICMPRKSDLVWWIQLKRILRPDLHKTNGLNLCLGPGYRKFITIINVSNQDFLHAKYFFIIHEGWCLNEIKYVFYLQLNTTMFCILTGSLVNRPPVHTGHTISPDTFTPLLILDTCSYSYWYGNIYMHIFYMELEKSLSIIK